MNKLKKRINENLIKEHSFCEATSMMLSIEQEMSTTFNDENIQIETLMNLYLKNAECLYLYMKAENLKYPALCIIRMDSILTQIIDRKNKGVFISDGFNAHCDNLYNEIASYGIRLTPGDVDFLHSVRMRRKSIYSENPLGPQTNLWGIKTKANRMPIR